MSVNSDTFLAVLKNATPIERRAIFRALRAMFTDDDNLRRMVDAVEPLVDILIEREKGNGTKIRPN